MIRWIGQTTDYNKQYTAEGESYKAVYEQIQDKYGTTTIIDEYTYELKVAEVNGKDEDDFKVDGELDVEMLMAFCEQTDLEPLGDEDYEDIIRDSRSQAYYQTFYEIPTCDEIRAYMNENAPFKLSDDDIKCIHDKMVENGVEELWGNVELFKDKDEAMEWLYDDSNTLLERCREHRDKTYNEIIEEEVEREDRFHEIGNGRILFVQE